MKYYYEKPDEWIGAGKTYICNHPLYNRCTLFQNGSKGLTIIQERFDKERKIRWWGPVDPWIAGDIYLNEGFYDYFKSVAGEPDENDLYPTVKVRSVMWALRMKPLQKEFWEEF